MIVIKEHHYLFLVKLVNLPSCYGLSQYLHYFMFRSSFAWYFINSMFWRLKSAGTSDAAFPYIICLKLGTSYESSTKNRGLLQQRDIRLHLLSAFCKNAHISFPIQKLPDGITCCFETLKYLRERLRTSTKVSTATLSPAFATVLQWAFRFLR